MTTPATPRTDPHQFYVTHCARADSVLGTVGFSVRASSSSSPALLKAAMEYPAYELPMDLWAKRPGRVDAPRRLARARTPDGLVVVHTGYLEKDTMNRDRSYFTHALLLPAATPADVLESWNSYTWATDYPAGQSKDLPAPAGVPRGTAISDAVLRAFLSTPNLGAGGALSAAVWPDRLRADLAARRELVARVVYGVLLATTDPARGRLFIHAEPGLVALLTYAAARLLPPGVVGDLTFTTYEPAHRALREFKRVTVIGTYLANPAKGLDPELATRGAYAVDTLAPQKSSPELLAAPPEWVEILLDLAAAGQRMSVKSIHALCPDKQTTAADIERAVTLAGGLERLKTKTHTPEDLVALQTDARGRAVLGPLEESLWPEVSALAFARADVRDAFRPWFAKPHRVEEMMGTGFDALAAGDPAGWQARWRLLSGAADGAGMSKGLERLLVGRADAVRGLPPDGRQTLRASLSAVPALSPAAIGPLLTPNTPEELDDLCRDTGLPGWAAGYALFTARIGTNPVMVDRARAHLAAADANAVGGYVRQVDSQLDARPELADELFDLAPDGSAPVLDKLLSTGGEYVSPARWGWAASRMKLFAGDAKFAALTTNGRLGNYLRAVGGHPAGQSAWSWATDRVNADFLTPGTPAAAVWAELDRADYLLHTAGTDPATVHPPALGRLRSAGRTIVAAADGTERAAGDQLRAAFAQFGLNEADGARRVFDRTCGGGTPSSAAESFDRFADVFAELYPPSETTYRQNTRSLSAWLGLAHDAPPKVQHALHEFYFADTRLSPQSQQQRLLMVNSEDLPHPLSTRVVDSVQREESDEPVVERPVVRRSHGTKSANHRIVIGIVAAVMLVGVLVVWKVASRGGDRAKADAPAADKKGTPDKQATPQPVEKDTKKDAVDPKKDNPDPKKDAKKDKGDTKKDAKVDPKKDAKKDAKKDTPPSAVQALRTLRDDIRDKRLPGAMAKYLKLLDSKPLPLTETDVKSVTDDIRKLTTALEKARAELANLPPADRTLPEFSNLDAEYQGHETGWKVRSTLLEYYKQKPHDSGPAVAAEWFKNVHAGYENLQGDEDRKRIRDMVQQYCEAHAPRKLANGQAPQGALLGYSTARDKIGNRQWRKATFNVALESDVVHNLGTNTADKYDLHPWNKLTLPAPVVVVPLPPPWAKVTFAGPVREHRVYDRLVVIRHAVDNYAPLFDDPAAPAAKATPTTTRQE